MANAAIILAAGKGTRMESDLPKVLHAIDGRPMVAYVIDAIQEICDGGIYLVVGYQADKVIAACKDAGVDFVHQYEQLGTGHAVQQCEEALKGFEGTVIVLNGDVPCLRSTTIDSFRRAHLKNGAAATVLSAKLDDPTGYGRIVKDADGGLFGIVEEKDADPKTKRIREINSGLFCFDKSKLFEALRSTGRENAQNEYYLTDVVQILRGNGETVGAYCVEDAAEVAGVNTEEELDGVRRHLQDRLG